jgi:hypothetical protein
MDYNKALSRIWKTWRFGFIAAAVIFSAVFTWAYNYEAHRQEESEFGEEPLELFQVQIEPSIRSGVNDYTVTVTNDQTYIITEVGIEFTGVEMVGLEDLYETYRDTVDVNSEVQISNMVYAGAVGMDIALEDTEAIGGISDINLYLKNEDGSYIWSSIQSGNSEEIHLNQQDLIEAGTGEYTATISHNTGLRPISFELIFRITYGEYDLSQGSKTPVEPQKSTEFLFTLNLQESQLQDLRCNVYAIIEFDPELEIDVTELGFVLDSNWNIISENRPIPEQISNFIPWGPVDLTGTSSAILYTITVIAGFIFFIRSKLKKMVLPRGFRHAHCFISLITLMFVLAHMFTALQKDWPWESIGMRMAQTATVLLVSFNIFSFFDVEIIKSIGIKKWRRIHLAFTIAMALSIIIHFGFMGDHLGFLK